MVRTPASRLFATSLRHEIKLLHHRAPQVLLAADECGGFRRRHRTRIGAERRELSPDLWLVEGAAQVAIDLLHDRVRYSGGCHQGKPAASLETPDTRDRFLDRWEV